MSSQRLVKVQKAIVQRVTDGGYTYIGAGTQSHRRYGLAGRSLEEIKRSVSALVARGIIKEHKPVFYSLPTWSREDDQR